MTGKRLAGWGLSVLFLVSACAGSRADRIARPALPVAKPGVQPAAAGSRTLPAPADRPKATPAPSPDKPSDQTPPVVERARVSLAAVGDMIGHGAVIHSAQQADRRDKRGKSENHGGYDALFDSIRPLLQPADLAFTNLETPIAPKAGKKSVPFSFNTSPDVLGALYHTGIRVVSFANNHVYDQRRDGLIESLQHLEQSRLAPVGAGQTCAQACAARIVEVKGVKFAWLAASTLYNQRLNKGKQEACACEFDEKNTLAEVARVRKAGADRILLSLHWGVEYHTEPTQAQIDLAHRLLDGGVDAILGHHPHVLQPVEVFQTSDQRIAFVAYSMGNFISNQSRTYVYGLQPDRMGNTRDGVILRFCAVKRDYGEGLIQTEWADLSVQPLWTENNALERRQDGKLPVIIRVVANDEAAASIRKRLAGKPSRAERVALQRKLILLEARKRIAAGILGEDLLYSPDAPQD